ncbi:hypothetical protein DFH29DRAFT_1004905 [Suillus ampliporus]|nr:hypothetical protein DFH29DRAFT_1004905 [Suillus ampliporus]
MCHHIWLAVFASLAVLCSSVFALPCPRPQNESLGGTIVLTNDLDSRNIEVLKRDDRPDLADVIAVIEDDLNSDNLNLIIQGLTPPV